MNATNEIKDPKGKRERDTCILHKYKHKQNVKEFNQPLRALAKLPLEMKSLIKSFSS